MIIDSETPGRRPDFSCMQGEKTGQSRRSGKFRIPRTSPVLRLARIGRRETTALAPVEEFATRPLSTSVTENATRTPRLQRT